MQIWQLNKSQYLHCYYYIAMLTNSDIYLCTEFKNQIHPNSEIKQFAGVPKNMQRTSPSTFTICEPCVKDNKTRVIEMSLNGQVRIIQEFEGIFTSWNFSDDYALLLNKDGDFLFYNMLNKNIHEAQKQHPGLYVDAEIMHTNDHFITCGGSVKNHVNNAAQRIIKVWSIDKNDCLVQRGRINTGHKKPIQHSFLINKSTVVSLSFDKSVRFTNLLTEQLSCVINTDLDLLSGCQIDYNTILAGGNSNKIKAYDQRTRRTMNICPKLNSQLVQIVGFTRFTENHVLVCNINQIHSLDLRNWQLKHLANYEGERISEILTLNGSQFVVGNREKTLQFWKAS